MALSNTPEPADTLDCETDQGVPEKTIARGSDCPVCYYGILKFAYYGRRLRCPDCDFFMEIDHAE